MALVALAIAGAIVVMLGARPRGPERPLFPDRTRPLIFAHRGGAGEGPESTITTMLATLAHNPAAVIELDVHQSRDGAIIVMHDDTVDRTTDGHGRITAHTLAELRALDAGYCATPGRGAGTARPAICRSAPAADFPMRGRGYRIATLDEVLQALPPDALVAVEVKEPGFEPALAALLRRAGRLDRFVVGSALDDVGQRLRALLPEVPHYFPRWAGLRFTLAAKLSNGSLARPIYQVLAAPPSLLGLRLDTRRLIAAAHRLSLLVAYFTIDQSDEMARLAHLGADALITDYPSRAFDLLSHTRPPSNP